MRLHPTTFVASQANNPSTFRGNKTTCDLMRDVIATTFVVMLICRESSRNRAGNLTGPDCRRNTDSQRFDSPGLQKVPCSPRPVGVFVDVTYRKASQTQPAVRLALARLAWGIPATCWRKFWPSQSVSSYPRAFSFKSLPGQFGSAMRFGLCELLRDIRLSPTFPPALRVRTG